VQLDIDRSKCLDITGGQGTNGTKLQLWDCADIPIVGPGYPGQSWSWYEDGEWQTDLKPLDGGLYGFAMDLTGGDSSNGNLIEIWPSLDSYPNGTIIVSPNQKFKLCTSEPC
jgi:hypothetical protein